MFLPSSHPWTADQTLAEHLESRGIPRRDFLEFCGTFATLLGLGTMATPRIAAALQQVRRPSVIWLQLQECTGCVESVLRSAEPSVGDLVLDLVSLDYSHTLMAASGEAAEAAMYTAMRENMGNYILLVSGSVPLKDDGVYTMIAGRTAKSHLEEAAEGAAAIIALGACAHWGSVQAAKPNPTGAVGVQDVIKDKPIVNIAGCPPIADVVTATIVHYLTFGRLPDVDSLGRPLFAYGARIHDQCSKRANFDAGQFVHSFDDEGARKGWCLYEVGCKGPQTFSPCPIFQWNSGTSWPIGAGHPCIGCTEPHFWDTMTPFYQRLPDIGALGIEKSADVWGAALAVGAVGGIVAHAAATGISQMRRNRQLPILGQTETPVTPEQKEDTDHGRH